MTRAWVLALGFWVSGSASTGLAAPAVRMVPAGQTPFELETEGGVPLQLSGLAWAGGNRYYAVSDHPAHLVELDIEIRAVDGRIVRAVGQSVGQLRGAIDAEDLVYDPTRNQVIVVDEGAKLREGQALPTLQAYHVQGGGAVASWPLPPALMERSFPNRNLESVALDFETGLLFTGTEDALNCDGPHASVHQSGASRLFAFTFDGNLFGQWQYLVDPIDKAIPFVTAERSGLVSMAALPGGPLLTLERALVGNGPLGVPSFRNRIYLVDPLGAQDIRHVECLEGSDKFAVKKRLLWEEYFGPQVNFEGLTIGPQLEDGSRSALLVSDSGGNLQQALYALRLYVPGAPSDWGAWPPPETRMCAAPPPLAKME